MGQSRTGRAIGGALSGAGGLLSQLATRRMAESQAQRLQDQQIQEARHKSDLTNQERGYSFEQLRRVHAGLDPGLTDPQKASYGFDAITNNGQTIPTVGRSEAEARIRFPNRMNDVPAVGPPGSLQQDVQTILGAREGMALNKPNTVRSVGMQDFPVPVPGGGPPDEFDSLLSSRMFDALNKPVGPAFPSERTAEQQALRDEIVGRGGARGAGFGAVDVSGSPEALQATELGAQARSRGSAIGAAQAGVDPITFRAREQELLAGLTPSIVNATRQMQDALQQAGVDLTLDPDNVARQLALESSQADIARGAGTPASTELGSAGVYVGAIEEHAKALSLEQENVSFPPSLMGMITTDPTGWLARLSEANLDPDQLLYLQTARSLVTDVVFDKSGAAVRDEEFGSFLVQMYAVGDDPAEVVEAKRLRRVNLISALGVRAGRAGDEAGKALVGMIAAGRLPMELIATIDMSGNPRMEQALDDGLKELDLLRD